MSTVHLLCAGAAKGLVEALLSRMHELTGARVQGRYGAVGAMQEALLAAEPCDLMVVTDAMVDALVASGALRGQPRAPLGRVRTGIAVRAGQPQPDVGSGHALRAALLAADTIYFPDPLRATAGIHFAAVMRELGVHDDLQSRFRTYPNGATAMRELAAAGTPNPIGCTQVTEINYTPGVSLVAALPQGFELVTVYTAALATAAASPEAAAQLLALLTGSESLSLRREGGFEA